MKYMGSKAKIAGDILPFIHSYILTENLSTYIEPFVGGCNVIDKVQCSKRLAYDKNKYLVALFQHLQKNGELPEDISRELYNDCRAHYQAKDKVYPDWMLGAVGFLASYNGRFFDGGYAKQTEGISGLRDYYRESKDNILEQTKALLDVEFNTSDYRDLKPVNSLVYCDPPYAGTKGYLTITKDFNHKEFWDIMREWSKNNIVLISEENAPDDFDVLWEQPVIRSINATDKKVSTEKLFIHHSLNKEADLGYDF